nr:HlyD family efflux transporter periplasmic adaptor subunit [Neorhizobium galegae]
MFAVLSGGIGYSLRPQPIPVDLATVRRETLRVAITDEGETRVRDIYTLHAPLRGHLHRLTAEPGDPVQAGETTLARIEPAAPDFLDVRTEAAQRAAVEAAAAARELAVAEMEGAKVNLEYAKAELARARLQSEHQAISKRTLEEAERIFRVAETALATTEAALEVREYEFNRARSQLLSRQEIDSRSAACECVQVKAPVGGLVLQVLRRSEGVVEAGTPLVAIGNPQDLEVVVDLLSEDAVTINAGQRALVHDWGGPDLEARVKRIEPFGQTKVSALGIEEQRVMVVLELVSPPESWRSLGHGFRVDVDVILFERAVPQLSLGAFFREGDDWAVFASENGRARRRKVSVGHRNTRAVEILSGLNEGDQVVLYPNSQIEDGSRIELRGR